MKFVLQVKKLWDEVSTSIKKIFLNIVFEMNDKIKIEMLALWKIVPHFGKMRLDTRNLD
jgi:hypothetical protein